MSHKHTFKCEKCGHSQSKKHDDKHNVIYPNIFKETINCKSLPVYVQFHHKGFWTTNANGEHVPSQDEKCDRNSVMIDPTSLFYVYKLAYRHLLLSMKLIEPTDIDNANLVPHVVVRKNNTDPFSKFKTIQDEKFLITEAELSAKNDFIVVELDRKRDLHMTLIYNKGIGKKINLVEAFINIIKLLNYRPELIQQYQSLQYFGQNEIDYWYETANLYPDNIVTPNNYVKPTKQTMNFKVTSAGSVIQ